MNVWKTIVYLLLLLLGSNEMSGQHYLTRAELITTEAGLANLMTTSIYKGSQGFIWVGTAYGLSRYDGQHFGLFDRKTSHLHADKGIVRIQEDEQGLIWLFYREGFHLIPDPSPVGAIDIFDPKAELAVPFATHFGDAAPFEVQDVCLPTLIDPQKRLWVHTRKGELFLHRDGQFESVFHLKDTFFEYITIDDQERIWLGWKDTLIAIDLSGKVLEKLKLSGQIRGIWSGSDSTLWLAMHDPGKDQLRIVRKDEEGRLIPLRLERNGQVISPQIKRPFLHRHNEGWWFVKWQDELHLFDTSGHWIANYNTIADKRVDTNFFDFVEDPDRLWLPSSTGIFKAIARENPFLQVHKKEKKLSDSRSIVEGRDGEIYFLNSKIFKWDPAKKLTSEIPNSSGAAYALLFADSIVWAGTYGKSPIGFDIDLKTGQRTEYLPYSLDKTLVHCIKKTDTDGRYLVGLNRGVAFLDIHLKAILPYELYAQPPSIEERILEQSEVNFIHENSIGYWLATSNGIFLLHKRQGLARHYSRARGDLPMDYIRHIYEDGNGVFWLSTKGGGIIKWEPLQSGNGSLRLNPEINYTQLTVDDGLTNNFTYAVYEDDNNKLWIPTDQGIMQMDKSSMRVRTFSTDEGLPHPEFNYSAHHQTADGTLYFGGLGGLIAFQPDTFTKEGENRSSMAFTGYHILEEGNTKMTDRTGLLRQADAITISPQDKFFELYFTLLDFEPADQHRYAYKIDGYSDSWSFIDEGFIRFTNLPYGNYKLIIQGQNRSLGWSAERLTLAIHVKSPFYLQWWFLSGLSVILFLFIRWWISKLKKSKELLEKEVGKRTRELENINSQLSEQNFRIEQDRTIIAGQAKALEALDEAKTRFFSNITHEFRTPLTLINGPLEQIISDPDLPPVFQPRLNGVLGNARRLLVLINQMLELAKIENGSIKVELSRGDIVDHTRQLIKEFEPLALSNRQRLSFVSPLERWETNFDREKWNKILYNLLSNALKFTGEQEAVQVSLMRVQKSDKHWIRLDVRDSGVGIKKEQLSQIFNRFFQADPTASDQEGGTGIGLALVKELVDVMGGEVWVTSEIGYGTSFELYIPVLEDAGIISHRESMTKFSDLPLPINPKPDLLPKRNAKPQKNKFMLLLIEDNPEMRAYIRHCIGDDRYHIIEAVDGVEGIDKAFHVIPDLIVSDIMMPKADGFAVVKAIREDIRTSHIPLVLLSARSALESRLEGIRRGADAYLTKPFSPAELVLRIDQLLEIRHLLQRRYQEDFPVVHQDAFQSEDEFIDGLRQYIIERIDHVDLNGDRIGRHFGISRVHLYRKLKALTGQSITEFVKKVRLQEALRLIREGKGNVSEIAYQTGFSSVSHFSRSFKNAFGKSPSEFLN